VQLELTLGGFTPGFNQGFFPNQDWQQGMGMNYPPPMMMGYPPAGPMMDQSGGGPHGLKRQRDG